jgi:hypothetical protein
MYHSACVHDNKIHADNDRVVAQMFSGNFEIKKFNTYDTKGAWLHGSFFLGCGSIDGGTTDEHMVSFCWKDRDGEYIVSKINVNNIKVKIEPGLTKPYLIFIGRFKTDGWKNADDTNDVNDWFNTYMTMVVIHCNEDDFKTDVNINSLK